MNKISFYTTFCVATIILLMNCRVGYYHNRIDYMPASVHYQDSSAVSYHDSTSIKVFFKSGPAGLELMDDNLVVKDGYQHIILGYIKIYPKYSTKITVENCDLICKISEYSGSDFAAGPCADMTEPYSRSKVLKTMQKHAAKVGGNAIIFVDTISEDPEFLELDALRVTGIGSAWIIILKE